MPASTIFIDADGDGKIAGDTNNNGVQDPGETFTEKFAITQADGSWTITGLLADLIGKEVDEFIPGTYVQTVGQVGAIEVDHYLLDGEDHTNFNFANFAPDPKIDVEKSVKTNLFGFLPEDGDDDPDGLLAGASTLVQFKVVVTNTGNETLENIQLTDSVVHTVNGVPTSQDIGTRRC